LRGYTQGEFEKRLTKEVFSSALSSQDYQLTRVMMCVAKVLKLDTQMILDKKLQKVDFSKFLDTSSEMV
jgi:hypothetical protein